MADLSDTQQLALIRETEDPVFLIHEGLLALNSLSGANDFLHGPLGLLAQGYERLMKLVVCLSQLEHEGALPSKKQMRKGYGHDLIALVDAIVNLGERSGYAGSRAAGRADIDFMARDQRLRALLNVLKDFGEWGRYYNLDALLDPAGRVIDRDDPVRSFERIELDILNDHPEWKEKLGAGEFAGFYNIENAELTSTFQRFARALCRMFTLGPLGDQGRRLQPLVRVFLFLRDEDLDSVPKRWFER